MRNFVCPVEHEEVPGGFRGLAAHAKRKHGIDVMETVKRAPREIPPQQLTGVPSARFEWGEPWDPLWIDKRKEVPREAYDRREIQHGDLREHLEDGDGNRRRISEDDGPDAIHAMRRGLRENGIEPKYLGVGGGKGNRAKTITQYTSPSESPFLTALAVILILAIVLVAVIAWAVDHISDTVYNTYMKPLGPLGFLVPLACVGIVAVGGYYVVREDIGRAWGALAGGGGE